MFGGRFNRENFWFDQVDIEIPNQFYDKSSAMMPLFVFQGIFVL